MIIYILKIKKKVNIVVNTGVVVVVVVVLPRSVRLSAQRISGFGVTFR